MGVGGFFLDFGYSEIRAGYLVFVLVFCVE